MEALVVVATPVHKVAMVPHELSRPKSRARKPDGPRRFRLARSLSPTIFHQVIAVTKTMDGTKGPRTMIAMIVVHEQAISELRKQSPARRA